MKRIIGLLAFVGLAAGTPARAEFLVGLTTGNALVTFLSEAPGAANAPTPVSGLAAGDTLLGIDFRPTNGVLYGLGRNNLYTLNANTGAVLSTVALTGGTLSGTAFGVDFNPEADRLGNTSLRVISNTGQNLAVNAATGAITTQTAITSGTISGSAYTNNDTSAATGTVLFGIDAAANTLLSTTNFAGGAYTTVRSLGVPASTLNGFDVSGLTGTAYAAFTNSDTGLTTLYSVGLSATGTTTSLGVVTRPNAALGSVSLIGLAALPAERAQTVVVPAPPTVFALAAALPALAALARRRRAA